MVRSFWSCPIILVSWSEHFVQMIKKVADKKARTTRPNAQLLCTIVVVTYTYLCCLLCSPSTLCSEEKGGQRLTDQHIDFCRNGTFWKSNSQSIRTSPNGCASSALRFWTLNFPDVVAFLGSSPTLSPKVQCLGNLPGFCASMPPIRSLGVDLYNFFVRYGSDAESDIEAYANVYSIIWNGSVWKYDTIFPENGSFDVYEHVVMNSSSSPRLIDHFRSRDSLAYLRSLSASALPVCLDRVGPPAFDECPDMSSRIYCADVISCEENRLFR